MQASKIHNTFTELFHLDVPIIQGPMGGVSGPRLVSAVAEAGALAILPIWSVSPQVAVEKIRQTKTATSQPFAVNIRADLVQQDHILSAVDEGVSILHLFWGSPVQSMECVGKGVKVLCTVWDEDSAKIALDAGASTLIAQGVEAGGHVKSTVPMAELVARLVDLAGKVPVVAAGGLVNDQDIKKVFSLGAQGALLGSVFVATDESDAHDFYKQAIINATEDSTVRTLCFDGAWPDAPHRVIRNSTFVEWENAGSPAAPNRPGEGDSVLITADGRSLPRYFVSPPGIGMSGELEAGAMYAGTGIERIDSIQSARTVIDGLSMY